MSNCRGCLQNDRRDCFAQSHELYSRTSIGARCHCVHYSKTNDEENSILRYQHKKKLVNQFPTESSASDSRVIKYLKTAATLLAIRQTNVLS